METKSAANSTKDSWPSGQTALTRSNSAARNRLARHGSSIAVTSDSIPRPQTLDRRPHPPRPRFAFAPIPGPALLYGRVSTADQTVETQTDAMRGHLARFIELQPAGEFTDPDTFGTGVMDRFLNSRPLSRWSTEVVHLGDY